jgi:GNAT superfamily N-acetyltransferase
VKTTRPDRLSIRPLGIGDLPSAALLVSELGYSATVAELSSRLHRIVASTDEAVFAADQDHVLLGWTHLKVQHAFESGAFVEIMGLVVASQARRNGVGRALVERAVLWAREHGYDRLRVRSNVTREGAHPFYEALGFERRKTQHVYGLELTWPPTR